jgi:hypothetical protein
MAAVAVAGEARPGGGGGLVVDEQQLTKLVDQLARNLNRGRDDFWLSSFGSTVLGHLSTAARPIASVATNQLLDAYRP